MEFKHKNIIYTAFLLLAVFAILIFIYFVHKNSEQEKYYAQLNADIKNEKGCITYALKLREMLTKTKCDEVGNFNLDECVLSKAQNEEINKAQEDAFNRCLTILTK